MRAITIVLLLMLAQRASAQRACATRPYTEQLTSSLSGAQPIREAGSFVHRQLQAVPLQTGTGKSRNAESTVIRIPVVVHILYQTASQNISDLQVRSQIEVLNRDFNRQNSDTADTPERFRSVAASADIRFELATADPNGRATNGIVRKQTTTAYWGMDDKIKFSASGGDNAWDSRFYLNIWVGHTRSLLGYSSVPGSPADKDGVVISTSVFGTMNTTAPFNLGRTAVHEVGHWLGLKHIWGDEQCGDDEVADTPKQAGFTPGCPDGFRSTCSNAPQGDMYMNFMDFTSDACVNLFTVGQKERMRAHFAPGGPRASLLTGRGLDQPWTTTPEEGNLPPEPVKKASLLFPNPALDAVQVRFPENESWGGKELTVVSLNGAVLLRQVITNGTMRIPVSDLKPGVYLVQGDNGKEKIRLRFVKL